jgi:hypothetical protein
VGSSEGKASVGGPVAGEDNEGARLAGVRTNEGWRHPHKVWAHSGVGSCR